MGRVSQMMEQFPEERGGDFRDAAWVADKLSRELEGRRNPLHWELLWEARAFEVAAGVATITRVGGRREQVPVDEWRRGRVLGAE